MMKTGMVLLLTVVLLAGLLLPSLSVAAAAQTPAPSEPATPVVQDRVALGEVAPAFLAMDLRCRKGAIGLYLVDNIWYSYKVAYPWSVWTMVKLPPGKFKPCKSGSGWEMVVVWTDDWGDNHADCTGPGDRHIDKGTYRRVYFTRRGC